MAQGTYHKENAIYGFLVNTDTNTIVQGEEQRVAGTRNRANRHDGVYSWQILFKDLKNGKYRFVALDPAGTALETVDFEVLQEKRGPDIVFPKSGNEVHRNFTAQVSVSGPGNINDGTMVCSNNPAHEFDETTITGPINGNWFVQFLIPSTGDEATLHNPFTLTVSGTAGGDTENGIIVLNS